MVKNKARLYIGLEIKIVVTAGEMGEGSDWKGVWSREKFLKTENKKEDRSTFECYFEEQPTRYCKTVL